MSQVCDNCPLRFKIVGTSLPPSILDGLLPVSELLFPSHVDGSSVGNDSDVGVIATVLPPTQSPPPKTYALDTPLCHTI